MKRSLVVTYDITGMSDAEVDQLRLEAVVQAEHSDHGHPSCTVTTTTMAEGTGRIVPVTAAPEPAPVPVAFARVEAMEDGELFYRVTEGKEDGSLFMVLGDCRLCGPCGGTGMNDPRRGGEIGNRCPDCDGRGEVRTE